MDTFNGITTAAHFIMDNIKAADSILSEITSESLQQVGHLSLITTRIVTITAQLLSAMQYERETSLQLTAPH
jgi:hypothetical protein